MNNKKIKGLLFSTAILGAIGIGSVNSYASEINEPTIEPATTQEYIAPEINETPAPVVDQEPVHNIEETQQTLESAETTIVEPEAVELTTEPVQEAILSETGQENIEEEKVMEIPAPVGNVESTPENEPTPVEQAPIVKQETEEENVVQNPEKVISQPKISASEVGGAGNYKISARGTGTIVIFVGRKIVEHGGVTGEISGIYSINVTNGQIDAQDQYLLSLAEDSYLYATGNVTFEISPVQEPIVEPETPTETEEETPAPEQPIVEQEKEKPVEPKEENVKEEIKGKYVGLHTSKSELGRVSGVYFDKDTNTLNFEGYEYYLTNADKLPKSIQISLNQKSVVIEDTEYTLSWKNGELVGMEEVEKSYSSQDDDINKNLSKYPTFSNSDRNDYDAKSLEKYEYINIDDENINDNELSYTAESLGFYYDNNSFGFNVKNFQVAINSRKPTRIRGIVLPSDFVKTQIFKQEIGKVHYMYTFTKNIQGGYDLVVIYFRIESDGTLTIVQDFHTTNAKGARYADIFAKVELEPTIEPEKPVIVEPETPTEPAPKEPEKIIEEEKVTEAKGKGVTPANQLNVESVEKAQETKPEKKDAAPAKVENIKAEIEEENVPETGNNLLHSGVFGVLGIAISTLGTAIFKFKK